MTDNEHTAPLPARASPEREEVEGLVRAYGHATRAAYVYAGDGPSEAKERLDTDADNARASLLAAFDRVARHVHDRTYCATCEKREAALDAAEARAEQAERERDRARNYAREINDAHARSLAAARETEGRLRSLLSRAARVIREAGTPELHADVALAPVGPAATKER
jgi:hypothetical protein